MYFTLSQARAKRQSAANELVDVASRLGIQREKSAHPDRDSAEEREADEEETEQILTDLALAITEAKRVGLDEKPVYAAQRVIDRTVAEKELSQAAAWSRSAIKELEAEKSVTIRSLNERGVTPAGGLLQGAVAMLSTTIEKAEAMNADPLLVAAALRALEHASTTFVRHEVSMERLIFATLEAQETLTDIDDCRFLKEPGSLDRSTDELHRAVQNARSANVPEKLIVDCEVILMGLNAAAQSMALSS